jgi:hypothetical protein
VARQRLRRAVAAFGLIRRGISACLRQCRRGARLDRPPISARHSGRTARSLRDARKSVYCNRRRIHLSSQKSCPKTRPRLSFRHSRSRRHLVLWLQHGVICRIREDHARILCVHVPRRKRRCSNRSLPAAIFSRLPC